MANRRIPNNIHKMKGTLQPSRHGMPSKATVATAKNKPPNAPSWMNAASKSEWRRIVKILAEFNILTGLDRVVMAQYCTLYAALSKRPETFTPAHHSQLRLLMGDLGFTPSARARLGLMQQADAESADPDGWDDL